MNQRGFRVSRPGKWAVAALACATISVLGASRDLDVGTAGHAFDHLGAIGEQAEAAAASGATIIYVTGVGALGYNGLPPAPELARQQAAAAAYVKKARRSGIRLAIGYLCATSIVGLEGFDKNWPDAFRAGFGTPPGGWRQEDRQGRPLASWYGGQYHPACMSHPDWRAYQHALVRQQLELGCDGVFFDNPTVHPQGCYCPHCMKKFGQFLERGDRFTAPGAKTNTLADLRSLADRHPDQFRQFRCTIARDFLADMRAYARTIKREALVTANNSLNSAEVLYSQCRGYAYNIYEMSRAEDLVVVEDMSSQPRILAGATIEYGPTYKQLRAVSHGKPVVAVTLAEADYHTPPNLVRLAMAEAAANGASYLWWPTWPQAQRARMISAIRPQAELLRRRAGLLNGAAARRDLAVFLPFRKWQQTGTCKVSSFAAQLSRTNLQYEIIAEDEFQWGHLRGTSVLLADLPSDFTEAERKVLERFRAGGGTLVTAEGADWLSRVRQAVARPSIIVHGPGTVRATVFDQDRRTIVHLLNLAVERLSSFEDRVNPAQQVAIAVRVPLKVVRTVRAISADTNGSAGELEFRAQRGKRESVVETTVPRLEVATILVIE